VKERDKFCLTKYLFCTLKGSLTYHKILQPGANSFTCPLKDNVLWIFIVLKIYRPRLGLNLQNLGPLASMLTTRPPRTIPPYYMVFYITSKFS
jgi:hypothetical protein